MKANKATHCPLGKGSFSVPGSQGHPRDVRQQNAMRRTESLNETAMHKRMVRLLEKKKQKWFGTAERVLRSLQDREEREEPDTILLDLRATSRERRVRRESSGQSDPQGEADEAWNIMHIQPVHELQTMVTNGSRAAFQWIRDVCGFITVAT